MSLGEGNTKDLTIKNHFDMILYQAHYTYGPEADDIFYYEGMNGELYTNKEACEQEAFDILHTEAPNIPIKYEIMEIIPKDRYEKEI